MLNEKSEENIDEIKQSFDEYVAEIKTKIGIRMLTDSELEVLAFNDIAHTFTRDERDYK